MGWAERGTPKIVGSDPKWGGERVDPKFRRGGTPKFGAKTPKTGEGGENRETPKFGGEFEREGSPKLRGTQKHPET